MNDRKPALKIGSDLLGLLLFLGLVNVPYFAPSFHFMPAHDTMAYAQQFFFIYNEYFLHGEVPLWQPYNLYGSPIDYDLLYTMSPALWFVAFIGRLAGATNALLLFKLAVLIEQTALLLGVYLLARRLFSHRATTIFVCIGTVATAFWGVQLYWNFRIYYLVPLVVFFLVRYSDTRDLKHLLAAAVVGVLSLLGNVTYCVPVFLFLYGVFATALFARLRLNPLPQFRTLFRPASLILLAVFGVLAAAFLYVSRTGFDFTMSYTPGRDPLTHRVLLESFFSYGSDPAELMPFAELIHAAPVFIDRTLFIGLIPLVFLVYALARVRDAHFLDALLITTAAVLLLSLSRLTCLSSLAYLAFPLFDYFRHLGLIRPTVKILLLVAAGYGLDRWISAPDDATERTALVRLGHWLILLIVAVDLFASSALGRIIPYAEAFPSSYATQFHLFDLCLAALFLLLIHRRPRAMPAMVVLLFSFEILSYHYLLFSISPATLPMPEKTRNESAEAYAGKVARLEDSLRVRSYDFQDRRASRDEVQRVIDQSCPIATRYFGAKYSTTYTTAYVDPCFQEYRVDYLPLSVDRLFRARFGIPLDQPLMTGPPIPDERCGDAVLLRALGCDSPKLFLTANVRRARDLDEAARLVRDSTFLDTVPVILSENTEAPALDPTLGPAGQVRVLAFSANRLKVQADVVSPRGAWLVYLDAFHPGWTVTVNGKPEPVATANLAFKAVHLPAGSSEVEFLFRGHRWSGRCMQVFFVLGIAGVLVLAGAIVRYVATS